MAISQDQRAMLQLLLEGGQSYGDIASLLGGDAADVRARARAALREMGGSDPDERVGLTDYLLGQADPIGRADAVRHLQSDPDDHALASRLHSQLRLLSPAAELPELPALKPGAKRRSAAPPPPSAPPAGAPAAPPPSPAPPPQEPSVAAGPAPSDTPGAGGRIASARGRVARMGDSRARLAVGGGAAALLLVAGVLAIAGVFSSDESQCTTLDTSAASQAGLAAVPLEPAEGAVGREGCPPTGQAVFAAATPNAQQGQQGQARPQVVLQTNLANLAETPEGQAYIIWLYQSDDFAFPLAQDTVGEDGDLAGGAPIPDQVIQALPAFASIRVSVASVQEARQALTGAGQTGELPSYLGETILAGDLPSEITQRGGGQGQAGGGGQGQGQGGSGQGQGG